MPRPPFRVFGLAAPQLQPIALAEAGRVDGEWETISLAYGDWADPAGPFITVTSEVVRPDAHGLGTEAELLGVIDQEHNRLADHAGLDEEEPPRPPDYRQEEFLAGDVGVSGLVCRHGSVWAARLPADRVMVTVAGRGVGPGSVQLGLVADVEPYLRGRSEMLGRLADRYRQRPPPVLEPAEGVAAYRALAEAALGSQARAVAARRARRVPRHRVGEGATMHALWQRAVREQARISGIGAGRAGEIVTLVVNHLTHLEEEAPWFTAEPRLREAAIDETLRHAVLGADVPSKPAQQPGPATGRTTRRCQAMSLQPPSALTWRPAGRSSRPGWRRGRSGPGETDQPAQQITLTATAGREPGADGKGRHAERPGPQQSQSGSRSATSRAGTSSTGNGRCARNTWPPVTCATCSKRPSRSSNAISSGWSTSGTAIQYDSMLNRSYTAFLVFEVEQRGAGRLDLDGEQRRAGYPARGELVLPDHYEIRNQLGVVRHPNARPRHDEQARRAGSVQLNDQLFQHDLMRDARGRTHHENRQASAIVITPMVPPV